MGRQIPLQRGPHRLRIQLAVGHQIGDQPVAEALVRPDDHGRVGDLRVGQHRGLDLARFDAESAHLDLIVGAAEMDQFAAGTPPRQVAGPVQPRSRRAERIGDEPRRGQGGPAEVPARDLDAADIDLARYARRDGP
ncbi:hypothetical protein NRB56_76500 [Nocardia sp. RB56]|uniref:Uncharacterized protein n=1 Tax=Nocardia aurantia TaxID=2585199 RepID=A0A7K0E1R9_9NOCA|nr:hypothetical protein [Nocardia aurantia]